MRKHLRKWIVSTVFFTSLFGLAVVRDAAAQLYWQDVWPFPDCVYPCTPELYPDECSCEL